MIDERDLFDSFHDALDMEPRPGAFERLQYQFTHAPVALRRRPAPRLRFSKMAFRIAAVAMAAIVVVALVGVYIATHRSPVGAIPAGKNSANVTAYRTLLNNDYQAMDASTSNHCNTIDDTACADAINRVTPNLQKWITDLQAFQTPAQYVVLDARLRAHLGLAITELNDAIAFQKEGNATRFNLAMNTADYERAWIDPTTFALEGTYPKAAASYQDATNLAFSALHNCLDGTPAPADLGCTSLGSRACDTAPAQVCESYVQSASAQIQGLLISLLQFAPPASRTVEVAALQSDLARADDATLALTAALLKGDASAVSAAESSYFAAIGTAADDSSSARA